MDKEIKFNHVGTDINSYKSVSDFLYYKKKEKANNINILKNLYYEMGNDQEYYYVYYGDYKIMIYLEYKHHKKINKYGHLIKFENQFDYNKIKINYIVSTEDYNDILQNTYNFNYHQKKSEEVEKKVENIIEKYFNPLIKELEDEIESEYLDIDKFKESFRKMIMSD